jgi:hypothetical protein
MVQMNRNERSGRNGEKEFLVLKIVWDFWFIVHETIFSREVTCPKSEEVKKVFF